MPDLLNVVDALEDKLLELKEHYLFLKSENILLRDKLSVLEQDLLSKDKLLNKQKIELAALKVSKTIEGSKYKKETSLKIESLIEQIDWCITQLSE